MRLSAGSGKRGRSRARSAIGLFAAVWLNIALQPCAMAYEAEDDHDCPHCPPAEAQHHHGAHEGMAAAMPCADGFADCLIDEDANHDARSGALKLKDAPVALFLAPLAETHQVSFRDRNDLPPRYSSIHPGAPPPIHKLNCVYLD